MACDVFYRSSACDLLRGKKIWIFGDSNARSMYKDLVWLLEQGTLVPDKLLQKKNEPSHANDTNVSNGALHSGRNYEEVREYANEKSQILVRFTFITRIYCDAIVDSLSQTDHLPDYLMINSCLWDLSRWGPNGVEQYKEDVPRTLKLFDEKLPKTTRAIFATTLPLSSECSGGFLSKEIEFLRYVLPWHIMEANRFVAECAKERKYDVLDLHYHTRFLIEEWKKDGIHFSPQLYRLVTNIFLTHVALAENKQLPDVVTLDRSFLERSAVSHDGKPFDVEKVERKNANNVKVYSKNENCFSQRGFNFSSPPNTGFGVVDYNESPNAFPGTFAGAFGTNFNSAAVGVGYNFSCSANDWRRNNSGFNFNNNNVVGAKRKNYHRKRNDNRVFVFGGDNSNNNNNSFAASGNLQQNNDNNSDFYMEDTFPQMNFW